MLISISCMCVIMFSISPLSRFFSFYFQILSLVYNEIFKIHPFAFKDLNALVTLDISHNQLTSAPTIECVKTTLRDLNLAWNYIKSISDAYFDSGMKLATLQIGCNQLIDIPNIQNIARTLRLISVGCNNISNVQPLYGIYFPRLQDVNLESNQIKSFCFPPVDFVPNLRRINLSANNLSRIQFYYPNRRRSGTVDISLGNNPWNCNASMGWIKNCAQEHFGIMLCMGRLVVRDMICSRQQEVHDGISKGSGRDMVLYKISMIAWVNGTIVQCDFCQKEVHGQIHSWLGIICNVVIYPCHVFLSNATWASYVVPNNQFSKHVSTN